MQASVRWYQPIIEDEKFDPVWRVIRYWGWGSLLNQFSRNFSKTEQRKDCCNILKVEAKLRRRFRGAWLKFGQGGCQFRFFSFLFFIYLISWRLITLQYCSGFCHTLTWISLGYTCIPHPNPPSHLPLHPFPLGFPSAPGPSTCLMHPTWAGDLFHRDKVLIGKLS